MLRRATRLVAPVRAGVRALSGTPGYVNLSDPDEQGIATLELARTPVNALDRPMLRAIRDAFKEAEDTRDVRAVLLTSASPSVFSAGLDLMELVSEDPADLRDFWSALHDAFAGAYGLSKPVAVAVCGSAPAGGCLLSLTADYRAMLDSPKLSIGLNEARLGIVAPWWFADAFIDVVGRRPAQRMLQLGALLPPQEALASGLVDSLHDTREAAEAACREELALHMAIPRQAWYLSKMRARGDLLRRFEAGREADLDEFVQLVTAPPVRKAVQGYVAALAKRG